MPSSLLPTIFIPWFEGFQLGNGVDVITGNLISKSAVVNFQPSQDNLSFSSTENTTFIQNENDFSREISGSISGQYNIQGVNTSVTASYTNKIQYSSTSTTLIARYEVDATGYDSVAAYALTSEAQQLLDKDPRKFRSTYGDYFIASGKRCSVFIATYVCKANSAKELNDFNTKIKAESTDLFSVDGSASFKQAVSSSNISVTADVFMYGFDDKASDKPNGPWTPEKVFKALEWFKQHAKGTYTSARLQHYSAVDNRCSLQIDIDPAVFDQLKQLYSWFSKIRNQYNICPQVYRTQIDQDYQSLANLIVANQSSLATNQGILQEYLNKANAIQSKLSAILARMDFFYKVKDCVEPGNGQEVGESAGGPQSWLYGYKVYYLSNAVSIQSVKRDYSDSWQIGWREANLDFNTSNALIVGWEVISNWGDGSNGSWWKSCDKILLSTGASVHVKSQYDRGCNWSVIYYYVDARDYQFS